MSRYGGSRRHSRRRKAAQTLPIALVVVTVLLVGLLAYQIARPRPGMAIALLKAPHIAYPLKATYNSVPPTSGPHYDSLADWGIHSESIPNELQVHNLEDGGVLVQYNCAEACPGLVNQLAGVVERYEGHVILAPYPAMDSRIALTAWGRADALQDFDERRIVRFIEAYRKLDHHE